MENTLKASGWEKSFENNWKRGRHMLTQDGFGWMMYVGNECVYNDEYPPREAYQSSKWC